MSNGCEFVRGPIDREVRAQNPTLRSAAEWQVRTKRLAGFVRARYFALCQVAGTRNAKAGAAA